jgi:hypothetical protein
MTHKPTNLVLVLYILEGHIKQGGEQVKTEWGWACPSCSVANKGALVEGEECHCFNCNVKVRRWGSSLQVWLEE